MLAFALLALAVICVGEHTPMLQRTMPYLMFHRDQNTTASRTSLRPQIRCVNDAEGCDTVRQVLCINANTSASEAHWNCHAIPRSMHFTRRARVQCEGYGHDEDEYVLDGSCHVEIDASNIFPMTMWSPHKIYVPGNRCIHGRISIHALSLWMCNVTHSSVAPGTDPRVWQEQQPLHGNSGCAAAGPAMPRDPSEPDRVDIV